MVASWGVGAAREAWGEKEGKMRQGYAEQDREGAEDDRECRSGKESTGIGCGRVLHCCHALC